MTLQMLLILALIAIVVIPELSRWQRDKRMSAAWHANVIEENDDFSNHVNDAIAVGNPQPAQYAKHKCAVVYNEDHPAWKEFARTI